MIFDFKFFWTAMASVPGIIALFIQLYEKLTTKPKIKLNIRRSEVEKFLDTRGFLFFRGNIFLEIGNIGKELTTITQIEFRTDVGHKHAVSTFEVSPLSGPTELGTVILRKSEAHLLKLHVWTQEEKDIEDVQKIYLWLRELSGKEHVLSLPLPKILKGMVEATK